LALNWPAPINRHTQKGNEAKDADGSARAEFRLS
jgi:hypothetical protein